MNDANLGELLVETTGGTRGRRVIVAAKARHHRVTTDIRLIPLTRQNRLTKGVIIIIMKNKRLNTRP